MSRGGFPAMLRVEAAKAARQPATWVLVGVLLAYATLIVVALSGILASPANASASGSGQILVPLRKDAVGFVASILAGVGATVAIIFAAQAVAQEFSRGTLRTLLLSRARRGEVVGAKLVLLALGSAALGIVIALASVVAALVFGAVAGERLLNAGPADDALLAARAFATLFAWAAIATGATLATQSLGMGIGTALGLLFVGDVLRGLLGALGTVGLWVSRCLPNAAIAALGPAGHLSASDWAWIAPNLVAWLVGLNAYAAWRLARLDVIAATK